MIYLSGSITRYRHPRLGFIITPDMGNIVPDDALIAADNACFANPNCYSDDRYIKFLEAKMPRERTIFATAPDILGDHAATVARSAPMLRRLRALGFKPAFVAQDGWREDTTPWSEFDVLFVGGTTRFKFRDGRNAVHAAKARGKWCHMGRVNSMDRFRASKAIGCDSADGTHLKFKPDRYWPQVQAWLESTANEPELNLEHMLTGAHIEAV